MSNTLLSQAEIDALLSQKKIEEPVAGDAMSISLESPETERKLVPKPAAVPVECPADAGEEKHDNLELILDIPLDVRVVLGEVQNTIDDVLRLSAGSIVEMERLAAHPVDIILNGKLIARGEVVVVGENFGVKISQIISPEERVINMA